MADIFGNRKKNTDEKTPTDGSEKEAVRSTNLPTPLSPRNAAMSPQIQQRKGPPVLAGKKTNSPLRPDIPRRGSDNSLKPGGDQSRQLVVGRDIALAGEIKDCERLVVEGSVEAALAGSEQLTIAETGVFRGPADVYDAEISGFFSGELTVHNRLVITSTGRVEGQVRYQELEIHSGGQISGHVEILGDRTL